MGISFNGSSLQGAALCRHALGFHAVLKREENTDSLEKSHTDKGQLRLRWFRCGEESQRFLTVALE
jgi:hypothetical protein